MKVFVVILALVLLLMSHLGSTTELEFNYDEQDVWPGICVSGNTGRQSPINIVREDLEDSDDLDPLKFGSGWSAKIDGVFFNDNGHTVRFNPGSGQPMPITKTSVGDYKVIQFHFHWGSKKKEGSEHRVDGKQKELEIHFVHNRLSGGDPGNQNAVVSVLGKVKDIPVKGIFGKLSVKQVQSFGASFHVSNIRYSDLLPTNRDYYYYEGSLTTPACTESVQWFVLKHSIDVPASFLEDLREVEENEDGDLLTFNFRDVQDLNDRVVQCFEDDDDEDDD